MKKTTVLLAAMLGAVAAGPVAKAQGIRLGLKGGASLSNLSGDLTNQDVYKNKLGFHGGLMLNVGLLDDGFLSLQPEVLFSQKGYTYADENVTIAGNNYRYDGDVTYNYLDVPVLLKIKAGGIFLEAGPQYSYLLKVKDESSRTLNGNVLVRSSSESDLSNVNRNEIGYAAGLGFQSDIGLLLGLRYNGSFTDFAKNASYRNDELRNARNSVFQLSVGYLLPGK